MEAGDWLGGQALKSLSDESDCSAASTARLATAIQVLHRSSSLATS